jgi:hypothetical protein
MGGPILRQAYLLASGDRTGQRAVWHPKVSKIVLFAATNRGVDLRRKFGIGPFAGLLERTGCYAWLPFSDFLCGSNFITNMRIRWLRLFRSLPEPPVVVQFLGQHDTMVATLDSADVDQFPTGYQFPVPGANHANVYRIDHLPDAAARDTRYGFIRECILRPELQAVHQRATGLVPSAERKRIVFVLHGIRDSNNNNWVQEAVNRIQQRDPAVEVHAPNQGYLTLLKFLSPTRRRRPCREFKDAYSDCVAKNLNVEFHFLGHSNGTYQLGEALREIPEMKFGRVVLAGSVLPAKYPWNERFAAGQLTELQNHMSNKDYPVGWVCNALRGIGMRDVGTGGFTGFERTGTGSYQPVAYYDGDHGAALKQPSLDRLVDYVLGEVPDAATAPVLRGLPSFQRRVSQACKLLAPFLLAGIVVGLGYFLFGHFSWPVLIAIAVLSVLVLLFLILY